MINRAHPLHFKPSLASSGKWLSRIRGLRANASRKSHAELNEATELDAGDPDQLAEDYRALKARYRSSTCLVDAAVRSNATWRLYARLFSRLYTEEWGNYIREKYGALPSVTYFESPVVVDNLTKEIVSDS